jgi:DNA-binding transcriptional MocR family regulator
MLPTDAVKPAEPPPSRTVDVLGNWAAGAGPLHRRLADAIRAAIERGELRIGSRLPPERKFAAQVSVSRSTVFSAWETLKREGWLESRRGSGTWITTRSSRVGLERTVDSMASLHGIFRGDVDTEPIDFTTAQLEGSRAIRDAVKDLLAHDLDGLTDRHHLLPQGLDELREAVAERFRIEHVPTSADQILITTGYQQAITLIASLLLRPGETAIVENPSSLGGLDALRASGARVRGVRVTDDGLAVEQLVTLMSDSRPRLVYLTPTFHNPTGTTLLGLHRRRIVRIAHELQIPIIEDLSHAPLALSEVPPPLAHYGDPGSVISIGSMSKLFWSGLRVGWIRSSVELITQLSRLKAVSDLGTPLLSQAVSARLLGRYDEVVAERMRHVPDRLRLLERLLHERLPDWDWTAPGGGLALWVKLPGSASEFTQLALRHGVVVLPGPMLSVTELFDDRLRLSFHLEPAAIEEGVRRLAIAWDEYRHRLS